MLKIVVLQGEAAVNNVKTKEGTDPVVEVRDERDAVVPGAEVTFTLPFGGPGGAFTGGLQTVTTRANEQGQAAGRGFVPNATVGRFNIRVSAADGVRTGAAIISQRNAADVAAESPSSSRRWRILAAIAGAGAGVGIYFATHQGGSTPPAAAPVPNSLTITAGTISIGGPH